jgi:DNA-binding NarL/FixJ family response regulator
VLDLHLPGIDGIAVLRRVRALGLRVRVLVLSAEDEDGGGLRARRAGADGYVPKAAALSDLGLALDLLARGRPFFRLATPPPGRPLPAELDDDALLGSLTDREFDILKAIAVGQSNGEIADALAMRSKAVSAVRVKLMRKLGTANIAALIEFARLNNVVPPPRQCA